MISDIAPHEKRTAIFLYLTASVLVTEMVAPILSVRLMESGEWTPLVISPIIQLAGTMLAIAFPETQSEYGTTDQWQRFLAEEPTETL
jgi:hypothetical protein